jgi:hypothetical protein
MAGSSATRTKAPRAGGQARPEWWQAPGAFEQAPRGRGFGPVGAPRRPSPQYGCMEAQSRSSPGGTPRSCV